MDYLYAFFDWGSHLCSRTGFVGSYQNDAWTRDGAFGMHGCSAWFSKYLSAVYGFCGGGGECNTPRIRDCTMERCKIGCG